MALHTLVTASRFLSSMVCATRYLVAAVGLVRHCDYSLTAQFIPRRQAPWCSQLLQEKGLLPCIFIILNCYKTCEDATARC